ncbi:MAG: hypothetical protein ACKVP4_03970 [Hyphomicrobium sp.]
MPKLRALICIMAVSLAAARVHAEPSANAEAGAAPSSETEVRDASPIVPPVKRVKPQMPTLRAGAAGTESAPNKRAGRKASAANP